MSQHFKYNTKQILVSEVSRYLDKYNNPVLGPAEQSELYGMALRKMGFDVQMKAGHVWVPHKKNRPPINEEAVTYDGNFGGYKVKNHVWLSVGKGVILDMRLRSVLGSDHPSVPHGVFDPFIYPLYRYQEIAKVKFYTFADRVEELYHCADLEDLSEKPKHGRPE